MEKIKRGRGREGKGGRRERTVGGSEEGVKR